MLHSHSLCHYSLLSTHLLTYISTDLDCRATVDLLSLTLLLPSPHRASIVAMTEVLKSTVSLTVLPNKNWPLVAMTQSPEVPSLSPKNLPPEVSGEGGDFGADLAWVRSKGDHNTCALARAVHSLPELLRRKSRFCPHEDLQHALGELCPRQAKAFSLWYLSSYLS